MRKQDDLGVAPSEQGAGPMLQVLAEDGSGLSANVPNAPPHDPRDIDATLTNEQRTALASLRMAGIFYNDKVSELDEDDDPKWLRMINLNDTFYWGCADCEFVPDDEIEEVSRLFWYYGWNGVLYWCAKAGKRDPEFLSVQRAIQFVENEEAIQDSCASASEHAYKKVTYTVGEYTPMYFAPEPPAAPMPPRRSWWQKFFRVRADVESPQRSEDLQPQTDGNSDCRDAQNNTP